MNLRQLQSHQNSHLNLSELTARPFHPKATISTEPGPSRRQFVLTAASAAIAGTGSFGRVDAATDSSHGHSRASCPAPKPIPGGFVFAGELFHVFPPELGFEPSSIFDFQGSVGVADIIGTGTLRNTDTGAEARLEFRVDQRFMDGIYVGLDGRRHQGTFGFV